MFSLMFFDQLNAYEVLSGTQDPAGAGAGLWKLNLCISWHFCGLHHYFKVSVGSQSFHGLLNLEIELTRYVEALM